MQWLVVLVDIFDPRGDRKLECDKERSAIRKRWDVPHWWQ